MPAISRLTSRPLVLALGLGLLLGGCGKKAQDKGTTAAGAEVLPGTISDDMIALDTSTASPPMAPVHVDKKKASAEASDAAEDAAPEEDAPAAAPAPDSADSQ